MSNLYNKLFKQSSYVISIDIHDLVASTSTV